MLRDWFAGLVVDPRVLTYVAANRVQVWQAITAATKEKNNGSYR